jgi:hypothetical protein
MNFNSEVHGEVLSRFEPLRRKTIPMFQRAMQLKNQMICDLNSTLKLRGGRDVFSSFVQR